jgi:hypothetical protein
MYETENCPYCGKDIKINHDDGYGYQEDEIYQQVCSNCGKTFVYEVCINYSYYIEKANCLNEGGVHDYRETHTNPKVAAKMRCTVCGDEKDLPKEKYEQYKMEYSKEIGKFLPEGN